VVYGACRCLLRLHIYLIHIMAILVSLAFPQPIWYGTIIADFAQKPPGYGHGLLYLRHVDSGRRNPLSALPVVHGVPEQAPGLTWLSYL